MTALTIASWNIQALHGAKPAKLGRVANALAAHRPDIIVLQEVQSLRDVSERRRSELSDANRLGMPTAFPNNLNQNNT